MNALARHILLGAKRHQQHKYDYFEFDEDGNIVGSCALGAALISALEEKYGHQYNTKVDLLLELEQRALCHCSLSKGITDLVREMLSLTDSDIEEIANMNDNLGYSREAIAEEFNERGKV